MENIDNNHINPDAEKWEKLNKFREEKEKMRKAGFSEEEIEKLFEGLDDEVGDERKKAESFDEDCSANNENNLDEKIKQTIFDFDEKDYEKKKQEIVAQYEEKRVRFEKWNNGAAAEVLGENGEHFFCPYDGRPSLKDVSQKKAEIGRKYEVDVDDEATCEDFVELVKKEYMDDLLEICEGEGGVDEKIHKMATLFEYALDMERPFEEIELVESNDDNLWFGGQYSWKTGKTCICLATRNDSVDMIGYAATLAHELWHRHQHETGEQRYADAKNNYYARADVDYIKYRQNLLEKEAFFVNDMILYELFDKFRQHSEEGDLLFEAMLSSDILRMENNADTKYRADVLIKYSKIYGWDLATIKTADDYLEFEFGLRQKRQNVET